MLFLGMMFYMLYSGNKIVTTYEPLMDASMELKFEATQAHLWFEEIISGDRNEKIDAVWEHLDRADWYATTMLEGGVKDHYVFIALSDQTLRQNILRVRKNLTRFRYIAEQRYHHRLSSGVGSNLDQEFDAVFADFIQAASSVERSLQEKSRKELIEFRQTGIVLIIASALLGLIITIHLVRNRKKRRQQVEKIQQSNLVIEEKNKELQKMALYDSLTNLPNRVLFTELLKTAVAQASRHNQWVVLFFIDLDQFKSVNDSLGHQAGDQLLQLVAERLSTTIRKEDTVARLSGDEFTVLLAAEDSQDKAIKAAEYVAKKIIKHLNEAFHINGNEVSISASIGIALSPNNGDTAETLLKNADMSMYKVKILGKNNFNFFSAEMEQTSIRRLDLEVDLRKALNNNELELYYQPQWSFKTGQLFGLEALVRWNHPEKGMIFPDEFIHIAESCGLIYQLDMWVLETACKQLNEWQSALVSPEKISVNLSAKLFASPQLLRDIAGVLADYEIKAEKIELEIIESVLMENAKHTQKILQGLKKLGLSIAVDDFGTGYSSMAYLTKFPIDTLKIDRSFVSEICTGNAERVIIETIVQMATKLNLVVVAEGIETAEQNRFLAYQGCHVAQGYFYNKPMPVKELDELLHDVASVEVLKQDKIVHLFQQGE